MDDTVQFIKWIILATCFALVGCSSDPATFLTYAQQKGAAAGAFDARRAPERTDALALNYANSVEEIFRARSTGARYTREGSDTALTGLAAFTGAAESLSISASSLSAMGLASAGILQLRNIFDAKGRSNAYFEAAERIHAAIKDYGAHNLNAVSETNLTPNGWTLANVVQSNIDIVNKILNGHLPSPEALAQASEPMSDKGATPQATGTTPVNNIPVGSLTAAVTAIPRHTGSSQVEPTRPVQDGEHWRRVDQVAGRASNLSDVEAIELASRKSLGSFPTGEEARDAIWNAVIELKVTKDGEALKAWELVLPTHDNYQVRIIALYSRVDKLTAPGAAAQIAKENLNKPGLDDKKSKNAIKMELMKLKSLKNEPAVAKWEKILPN